MRTIYRNDEFVCFTENDGTLKEIAVDCFDGKCREYINGHRYLKPGESWEREDGKVFTGEMLCPLRDLSLLNEFQEQYDRMMQEATSAYWEGVNSVD